MAQRIVNHLKGTPDADGAFRHFVKKERLCVGGLAIGWNKRRPGCFCERKESGTNPYRTMLKGHTDHEKSCDCGGILEQVHSKDCLHAGAKKTYARVFASGALYLATN